MSNYNVFTVVKFKYIPKFSLFIWMKEMIRCQKQKTVS